MAEAERPLISLQPQRTQCGRFGAALSRRKPVDDIKKQAEADGERRLEKTLDWKDLIGYGVGSTVGAGIYTLIGSGAVAAGPAICVSFVLCAMACFFTSLCYSEFAARIPVSGSAYTFAYASIGEFLAWVIGWNLTLEYGISAAAVARGWAGYFSDLCDIDSSVANQFTIGGNFFGDPFVGSPLAASLVVVCTLIAVYGVQLSSRFNNIMTGINVCIIVFLIIAGFVFVDPDNWTPFAPEGVNGMVRGAAIMFFSYIGFDCVSCMAEETKDASRDVPRGTIGSLFISAILYVLVGLSATGMAPVSVLNSNAPLSDAFRYHNQEWAARLISFGCVVGGFTSTLTSVMGQPRIYFSMARDGLLGESFTYMRNGAKQGTPVWGCLVTGVLSGTMAFFIPLETLSDMISIGTLCAFAVVNAGMVVLRYESKNQHSLVAVVLMTIFFFSALVFGLAINQDNLILWQYIPPAAICLISFVCLLVSCTQTNIPVNTFKCPLVPWFPCAGILMVFYVLGGLEIASWYRFSVWSALGITIYFAYGMRHSKLGLRMQSNPLHYSGGVSDDDEGAPGPSFAYAGVGSAATDREGVMADDKNENTNENGKNYGTEYQEPDRRPDRDHRNGHHLQHQGQSQNDADNSDNEQSDHHEEGSAPAQNERSDDYQESRVEGGLEG